MSDLFGAMAISSSGMRAQSERTRIIAENVANSDNTPQRPGEEPYARKTITFKNILDKEIGGEKVEVAKIGRDTKTPFVTKYMPGHPAANAAGYVQTPNVNTLIEMTDAREAQRSYEANLGLFTQSRDMSQRLIDMLR